MEKLYVDAMTYLQSSKRILLERIQTKDEDGFAAAEQIALAVAGVIIVAGVFVFFQRQVGDGSSGILKKVTDAFNNITP